MTKQKVTSFFGFLLSACKWSPVKPPPSTSGQSSTQCLGSKDPCNFMLTLSRQPRTIEIACAFGHLTAASVVIPSIVQAMILLNALPHKYENIGQMLLQTETISTLMFKIVQDGVLAEHARHSNHLGLSSTKVSKLSNVKPKGANPKWQPRKDNDKGKQRQSSAEPCEQVQKKCCGIRSGKQQREKQVKEMQASLAHSHLALSFAAPPRPFTTVNGRGTITETSTAFIKEVPVSLPTKDPQRVPPPQAYMGLQAGPSFYEADNC